MSYSVTDGLVLDEDDNPAGPAVLGALSETGQDSRMNIVAGASLFAIILMLILSSHPCSTEQ